MAVVSSKRDPQQHAARRAARAAADAAAAAEREARADADPSTFAEWSALIGTDPNGCDGEMVAEQRRVLVTRPQHPGVWASEVRTDDRAVTAREALAADTAALLGNVVRGRVPVQALRNAARCVMLPEGNATVGTVHPSGAPKVVAADALRAVTAEQYVEACEALGLPVALLSRVGDVRVTWAEARALIGSARDAATRDRRAVVGATPYVRRSGRVGSGGTGGRSAEARAERNVTERDARRTAAAAEALAAASSDTAWPQPKRGRPSLAVTLWRDLLAAAEGNRAEALTALRSMV